MVGGMLNGALKKNPYRVGVDVVNAGITAKNTLSKANTSNKTKQQDNVWAGNAMTQEEISALIRSPHNQYYAYYNYAHTQDCGDKPQFLSDIVGSSVVEFVKSFSLSAFKDIENQKAQGSVGQDRIQSQAFGLGWEFLLKKSEESSVTPTAFAVGQSAEKFTSKYGITLVQSLVLFNGAAGAGKALANMFKGWKQKAG